VDAVADAVVDALDALKITTKTTRERLENADELASANAHAAAAAVNLFFIF
jgi:hypothetical protein